MMRFPRVDRPLPAPFLLATPLLAASLLLGGCGVLHKLGFGSSGKNARSASLADERFGPGFTGVGRRHLDEGNYGIAVEAFQQALGRNEPRGPALNGLAVAYAKLDRPDLAEQLFRLAIAADPANTSYVDNLALLTNSQQDAVPEVRQAALPADGAAADAQLPAGSAPAIAPAQADGRLVRVAPRQFEIHTQHAAPAMARGEAIGGTFRPVVRIVLRSPAPAAPAAVKAGGAGAAGREASR